MKTRGLLCIVLLGALLRFVGLFDDLWLDEIWSWVMVTKLSSPLEIIAKLFHDNNHLLNSLFIYCIGKQNPDYWFKFRLLSFLSGTLSIWVVYLIAGNLGMSKKWRWIVAFFVATSFPLIVYSCEARGYSSVVFFSLLSFYLVSEYFRKRNSRVLFFFQYSFLLGFLSHLSFVYIAMGLFIASNFIAMKEEGPLRKKVLTILKLFAVPVTLAAVLYYNFIFHMQYGGGNILSKSKIINETLAYLIGYPAYSGYIVTICISSILIYETVFLIKKSSALGIFCLSCALVIFIQLLCMPPALLYFRYFLCIYPFFIILLSHFLYSCACKYPRSKPFLAVFIILIVAGNIKNTAHFLIVGRGHYLQALNYMRGKTKLEKMTISSDHDFRNGLVLYFYNSVSPDKKELMYVPGSKAPFEDTEWFITHSLEKSPRTVHVVSLHGHNYTLEKHYPYCGMLSGFHWFIYHRDDYSRM